MKKIIILLFISVIFLPAIALAQDEVRHKGEIVEVGETFIRIDLENNERISIESDEHESRQLKKGDKVLVNEIKMDDGGINYVLTDMIRVNYILFLIGLFIVFALLVAKKQGAKSLVSLFFSVFIIAFVLVPLILKGYNPLWSTIIVGSSLFLIMTYFTYGINRKANAAIVGTISSMFIAGFLAWIFVGLTSLSGFANDEAPMLINLGYNTLDMRGILLAAIIIGTLGVLDDVAINQASIVNELVREHKKFDFWHIYSQAMRVGTDHMSSMVNTLLFAYIGASFPLFILFTTGQPPFDSLGSIINNEIVATEIVRTLVGSIALLLAVPITTLFAVKFIRKT